MASTTNRSQLHAICTGAALISFGAACVGGVPPVETQQAAYEQSVVLQEQSEKRQAELPHVSAPPPAAEVAREDMPEMPYANHTRRPLRYPAQSAAAPTTEEEVVVAAIEPRATASWSEYARDARNHQLVGELEAAATAWATSYRATESLKPRDVRPRTATRNLEAFLQDEDVKQNSAATRIATEAYADAIRRVRGEDDPELPIVLRQLGGAQLTQGRAAEAEATLDRALALLLAEDSRREAEIALTTIERAKVYQSQGRTAEAETLFRRAAEDLDAMGVDQAALAAALNELAWFYASEGRAAEGEPYARRALDMANALDLPDAQVAGIHDTLASTLAGQGLASEAEKQYKAALEKSGGAVWVLRNYASFLRDLGRDKEADALDERADEAEASGAERRRARRAA